MTATPDGTTFRADASAEPNLIRFGLFELDLENGELRRSGRVVRLPPQPTRVLIVLASRAGELVTREELKTAVWGDGTFVDFEQGLTFCVKQIRAALGDAADNPRFIETVPRRGYRLIAPVHRHDVDSTVAPSGETVAIQTAPVIVARSSRRRIAAMVATLLALGWLPTLVWISGSATTPTRTTIAVLPFEMLDGDDDDYFADGFAGELIGQLGQISPNRLGVIARTSTLAYRQTAKSAAEIGAELGAGHLVEGTVRKAGDRIRVNVQLIRTSDQSHVWAEIFDGEVRDVLKLQRDVGEAIARHIIGTLAPTAADPPRNVDPEVYDLYLRSRALWNRRADVARQESIAGFREAIRRDPKFAPAYAGLADSLTVDQPAEALAAAERALALDDRIAEAHRARAHILMHRLEWGPAEASFRRAIAIDPSDASARFFFGEFLATRGRCDEAMTHGREAIALDPFSAITIHAAGVVAYYCGRYDDALRYLRRAIDLDPAHSWTHTRIGMVLERQGAFEDAIAALDRGPARLRSAYTRVLAGRTTEARSIIDEEIAAADPGRSYDLAAALVAVSDHAGALERLSIALEHRAYDVVYLAVDPRLAPLRARAEFRELLRRGGFE